jgi:hypothetical protein
MKYSDAEVGFEPDQPDEAERNQSLAGGESPVFDSGESQKLETRR